MKKLSIRCPHKFFVFIWIILAFLIVGDKAFSQELEMDPQEVLNTSLYQELKKTVLDEAKISTLIKEGASVSRKFCFTVQAEVESGTIPMKSCESILDSLSLLYVWWGESLAGLEKAIALGAVTEKNYQRPFRIAVVIDSGTKKDIQERSVNLLSKLLTQKVFSTQVMQKEKTRALEWLAKSFQELSEVLTIPKEDFLPGKYEALVGEKAAVEKKIELLSFVRK